MKGQQAIPVVAETPIVPKPCAWCGKDSWNHIEVEPARFRNHNGVRVVAKPARMVPVCAKHYRTIIREGE